MNEKSSSTTTDETAAAPEEADSTQPTAKLPEETSKPPESRDPVRRLTVVALLFATFLFGWYVLADRFAPWTDQARVQAFVVPIAPEISGRVEKVHVLQDQPVAEGDLLIEIDPRDYELAVADAEAALELAGQDIGASTDEVAVVEAKVTQARAQLEFVKKQAERYLELAEKGTISKADADKARAEVEKAVAEVASVKAELDKAKEQLGREGGDNPKIRAAVAALETAQLDLAATKIYAPSDGGITNLTVDEGHYATGGVALMTFVSFSDVWVQANLRENSIGNVELGNPVEIILDMAPGKVFKGEVVSKGFAVQQPSGGEAGELTTIKTDSGWLRSAQRFPVIIRFSDDSAKGHRALGGQADVQIYTGDNFILNALGRIWIRLMSYLSYVY